MHRPRVGNALNGMRERYAVERVYPGRGTAQRHVPYRTLRVRIDVPPP
jgi:hypothetical protein